MHNCLPNETPIVKGDKFSRSQSPKSEIAKESIKHIPHAFVVASLMYVQG